MKKHCKTKAFSLGETMTTLLLVGVVSAFSIPIIVQNYQDSQFKTAWKNEYNELARAQKLLNVDYAENFYSECNDFDDTCLRDLFATIIEAEKKCDSNRITDCFENSKFLDGRADIDSIGVNGGWPMLITPRGSSIKFRFHKRGCAKLGDEKEADCGWMQVDVNGKKGPNVAGKDIFFTNIFKDRLSPMPSENKNVSREEMIEDCKHGSGMYCSRLYLGQ